MSYVYLNAPCPGSHTAKWFRCGLTFSHSLCVACQSVPGRECRSMCMGCHRPLCGNVCEQKHLEKKCVSSFAEREYTHDLPTSCTDDEIASAIYFEQYGKVIKCKKQPCPAGESRFSPQIPEKAGCYTVTTTHKSITFRVHGLLAGSLVPYGTYLDTVREEGLAELRQSVAMGPADLYDDPKGNLLSTGQCAALNTRDWMQIAPAFNFPIGSMSIGQSIESYFQNAYEASPGEDAYFAALEYLSMLSK